MILQACESCGRQYDVTHLAVGNLVRCLCDAKLSVSRPRALTVRARKCSSCGGRVEPGDVACTYCNSELLEPDQKSTLCPHCFVRIEESAKHCAQCGVEIAPQALTALRDGQCCPRCKSEVLIRSLGEASVVECTSCLGMWVTSKAFGKICRRAQERAEVRLDGREDRSLPALEPESRVTYIPCLVCGEMMLRRQFRYRDASSRVVVDYCREHGVWLDSSELERIVAFVRRRSSAQGSSDLPPTPSLAGPATPPGSPSRGIPPEGLARPSSGSFELPDSLGLGGALIEVLGEVFGAFLD